MKPEMKPEMKSVGKDSLGKDNKFGGKGQTQPGGHGTQGGSGLHQDNRTTGAPGTANTSWKTGNTAGQGQNKPLNKDNINKDKYK